MRKYGEILILSLAILYLYAVVFSEPISKFGIIVIVSLVVLYVLAIVVCKEISKISKILIVSLAVSYLIAGIVCNQVLIKNVFDEIYYSEMQPFFFKYTNTSLLNLRENAGIISPNDPIYRENGITKTYSTRKLSDTMYGIQLCNTSHNWDVILIIYKISDVCKITYYYYYDIEQKVLTCSFSAYSYDKNGKEVDREDDIYVFFEETGLSYDYIGTQQELELDVFLDVWFEKNEGLSRFSPDDLGNFTVEDVGARGLLWWQEP